ncbi:ATP-dependent Clp protease proteolytic subunit [Devosia sp.]|uniref:ATP-dependent Clp protease proteolytic subunit n=1 Tax=Devosia sp. TaxID=1871048 RepID=UPI003A93FEB0
MSAAAPPRRRGFLGYLARLDDGVLIRTAFFAMLAGTIGVLYVDYRELSDTVIPDYSAPQVPILPAFDPDQPAPPAGPDVTADPDMLSAPMVVSLQPGGVLALEGSIDPDSFERVAAEVTARGEYVERVSLNSPGGVVDQALKIGALLRERGFTTEVAAGALCASSCPLVLAGGVERLASPEAAIGVHQIYAVAEAGQMPAGVRAAGDAMSETQKTTAAITRYLEESGVDPAIWLHALETPPNRLYYLSTEELTEYRLVTELTK